MTAYEMRISDWSSDVFSSDLDDGGDGRRDFGAVAVGRHRFRDRLARSPARQWRLAGREYRQSRRIALRAARSSARPGRGTELRGIARLSDGRPLARRSAPAVDEQSRERVQRPLQRAASRRRQLLAVAPDRRAPRCLFLRLLALLPPPRVRPLFSLL